MMKEDKLDRLIDGAFGNISYVIRGVGRRGLSEDERDADDFRELLQHKEFRSLVVGELYESYFLPDRHEFDWHVLHEIVTIMSSEQIKEFLALAVVSGLAGNGATVALRALFKRIIAERKRARIPSRGEDPFVAMNRDIKEIESFFQRCHYARISEIEVGTGIARERLYPLLKLTGFTHYRRRYTCYWCSPGTATPGVAETG